MIFNAPPNSVYKPKATVLIPLYNKETEVKRAINSVLNQSIPNFELIVINDGSTDRSAEIVRSIDDSRIRIINQENAGVSAARNRGIHEAQADLIAFLDADDEWRPSFLETIFNLKEKFPDCKVYATNYMYGEVSGKYRLPIIKGLPSYPWEGTLEDYFGVACRSDPPICSSSIAVDKKAIQSIGFFPVGVTSGEDLLTWAKLAVHYDIAYSSKPESVFWLREPLAGTPVRLYDKVDIVGNSLELLLDKVKNDKKEIFKQYISLWYKMKASTYLKIGWKKETLIEIGKMRKFSKGRLVIWMYLIISIMPEIPSKIAIKTLTTMKKFQRKLFSKSLKKKI